jgi:uncharacterized protein YkwD
MFVAGPAAAQVLTPKDEGANAEHQSKEAAEETERAVEEVTYTEDELEMVRLINEHREQNGLDPLLVSDSASLAAERHSADMAKYGYMDHESQQSEHFETGADSSDRLAESGYAHNTTTGENIAANGSAQAVFDGWKESPAHDEIMLHEDLEVIGVGMERADSGDSGEDGDGRSYWTTDFGGVEGESARKVSEIEPANTPQGEETGLDREGSTSGDQYGSSGNESSNEDSGEGSSEGLPDGESPDDSSMTSPEGNTPEVTIHEETGEEPEDTAKEQTEPDEQSSDEQSPDQEATEPEPDQGTGQSPQDEAEDEGTTQGSGSPENPGSGEVPSEEDTPINGPANQSGGDEPSGDEPTEDQPRNPSGDQYGSEDEGSNESPDGGDGQDQPEAGPTGEPGTEPGGGPKGSSGDDCDTMEGFDNDPFRDDFGSDLQQRIQSKVDCHLADAGIGDEDGQPTADSPGSEPEGGEPTSDESMTSDDGG